MKEAIWRKLHNFIKNGGWIDIIVIAFFGILSAVISHYSILGFNWKWFIFFEMPLYIFCGWVMYNIFKKIKTLKK